MSQRRGLCRSGEKLLVDTLASNQVCKLRLSFQYTDLYRMYYVYLLNIEQWWRPFPAVFHISCMIRT